MDNLLSLFCILATLGAISAAPEQGKFSKTLSQDSEYAGFVKTLYKNSTVRLKVTNIDCEGSVQISWLLRSSSCYGEYEAIFGAAEPAGALSLLYVNPEESHDEGVGYFLKSKPEKIQCQGEHTIHVLTDYSGDSWTKYPKVKPTTPAPTKSDDSATSDKSRRKRADSSKEDKAENDPDPEDSDLPPENPPPPAKLDETASKEGDSSESTEAPSDGDKNSKDGNPEAEEEEDAATEPPKPKIAKYPKNKIARVRHTAPYILVVFVTGDKKFSVKVEAEMETPLGYLSAHDYPLKTFYMIMCIVYSLYAVAWLVVSACNFRDLLRVQFWIGGVILLGMIEKAVFYSEYLTVNTTGTSVMGAVKFAEVISALKRSLARMLVIIVSLGFGIVKPRLGPMLHRVIGIGILYFIIAIVEALVRNDASTHPGNYYQIYAAIPLAVIDSIICWWIFMSLMQTMKTLRLRRNVVKLSLYRHFSNTIIFCVIASLAMILYSFRYRDACETAWQEKWIDVAFWHILFSIILLVIMVLWRPNVNNQRYAFSPLLDADEEGAEEPMLGSGATETVKMRGLKHVSERRDPALNAEDNLKWIEENIPETIADSALPAIMDSDEEIVASRYEMSKME